MKKSKKQLIRGMLKKGDKIYMPCANCSLSTLEGWTWYNEKNEPICDLCADTDIVEEVL